MESQEEGREEGLKVSSGELRCHLRFIISAIIYSYNMKHIKGEVDHMA